MRTEDGYIISKCLNEDPAAFGLLVDKYKESIYALAYSKLGNFHDAEDITQEVFTKAYQKLNTLKRWDSFLAWLYSITSNLCKMLIRSRSRMPDSEYIEDQDLKALSNSSFESYQDEDLIQSVHETLSLLPEIHRQVLTLFYLGGMSTNQIARLLGTSPNTVLQRLHKARSRMREEMLGMMKTTFEEQKLPSGFTLRVVEILKNIRIEPISPAKALPWGLSLAAGIIATIIGFGTNLRFFDQSPINSLAQGGSRVLKVGLYPIDAMKLSDTPAISSNHLKGNGPGIGVSGLQNAFFITAQTNSGTWTKKTDMVNPRMEMSASIVNGNIYVIGGINRNEGNTSLNVDEYNPIEDKWTKKADMPTARQSLSTCELDGKIYAIGGFEDGQPIEYSVVEVYDPKTDKWVRKANMPTARQFFSTNAINGRIYAIGGWRGAVVLSATEEYDPVTDKWTKKTDMPTKRFAFASSVVNGKIYVIGGSPLGGLPISNGGILSIVEEYDPLLDKWTQKADMPTARMYLNTCVIDDKIYAIGGCSEKTYALTIEVYDPITNKWTKRDDVPSPLQRSCCVGMNGKIYIIGGGNMSGIISTVNEYIPSKL